MQKHVHDMCLTYARTDWISIQRTALWRHDSTKLAVSLHNISWNQSVVILIVIVILGRKIGVSRDYLKHIIIIYIIKLY